MQITLPTKKGTPNKTPLIDIKSIVVIGANGAGKTRFGARIEENNLGLVHRISAQKSLQFPSEVSPTSREKAEKDFFYGTFQKLWDENTHLNQKKQRRWGSRFSTHQLNDFDKLLVLLHTEEYEEALSYKEGRIRRPTTKLDKVQQIWEMLLPHRKLIKRAGVIETYPVGQEAEKYNAAEMSDGERVIFYLIGETVCVPENSIIIFDEPEMHIHKSLVKKLFDLIENERQDCSFIYLTHDIDFAFTRQKAVKIWAKSYEGSNVWDYEILDEDTPIPEQLYLEILGSRESVLFIEGDNSSIDYELYEQVFSNYTLKPLGSCQKVIQTIKPFNDQNSFHQIQSFGIIDRDRRSDEDVMRLNSKNIWVLDVAEAENLLLIEAIVKAVANHMGKNQDDIFNQVRQNLIDFFERELENQILLHFKKTLEVEMTNASNFSQRNIADVMTEVDTSYLAINKQQLYNDIKAKFEQICTHKDYDGVLRIFNLKDALIPQSKICRLIGLNRQSDYRNLVITLLKKKNQVSSNISHAIKQKIIGIPITPV